MPIPENPIEYLVYRFKGRWELTDEDIKEIGHELYRAKYPNATADQLALQAYELPDEMLHLLLPELPVEVMLKLSDMQV
jgi:hypothetical protein